jgi:hypothetical protein
MLAEKGGERLCLRRLQAAVRGSPVFRVFVYPDDRGVIFIDYLALTSEVAVEFPDFFDLQVVIHDTALSLRVHLLIISAYSLPVISESIR